MVAQQSLDEPRRYGALDVVYGMPRFHFTGSLAPSDVYVERPADRLLPALLRQGTYCHILAPRQIGKSSLRWRVTRKLQEEGIRCASIDLTVCGSAVDPEQWYYTVAAEIAEHLKLADPLGFWEEHRNVTAPRRLASYLSHILKTDPEKRRVVVFLDEIESVRLVSFPVDDFLLAIRGLFEARSGDEDLGRLTFCLIGVTTPNDLVKDKMVTPFNVSTQVRLDDFTREQIDVLGPGLADLGAPVEALLDAVYEWTDGHPYMTMRACAALVGHGRYARIEPGQERETVALVVREQFLERPLEDGNLGYAMKRFTDTRHERLEAPVGDRIDLYRRLLEGKCVVAGSESVVQMELRLSGMVKDVEESDGRWLRVRNKIFATALNRDWLDSKVSEVVDLVPTFRMRADGSLIKASVSLFAAYEEEIQVRADGITPPVLIQPPEEGMKRARGVRVDIAAQQDAAGKLLALGLRPDETGQAFVANGDAAIRFWGEGLTELPDEWDLFVPEDLVDTQVRSKPIGVFAKVTSGMDWLNVKLSYESEGVGVDRDELRRCLAQGKKYVRLEDGSFAPFNADTVKAMLDREVEFMTAAGKGGKLPLAQAGRIQELLQQASGTSVTVGARELFQKLGGIKEIEVAKKPRALRATLLPYQEAGLSWLKFIHDIGSGGVLADEPGRGRMVQTIALLLAVKEEERPMSALIVAPTSMVRDWERELAHCSPTLSVVLWHGADRHENAEAVQKAEVVITSYELLWRDEEFLSKLDLTYAILDEAQHIKNPMSATATAAKRLRARRRLALTNTPIEDRLSEIWSIFDYVSPGLLGPLDKFEQRFSWPIKAGDHKTAQRLRAIIHPFILRRTKQDIAKDLPTGGHVRSRVPTPRR